MSSKTRTTCTTKLTIAQWQQGPPNTSTAVSKSNGTIKCGHCCKTRTKEDVVVCTTDCPGKKKVDIFCYNCWDSTTWHCSDCNTVPDESEVVGCECCGQWVHNGCSVYQHFCRVTASSTNYGSVFNEFGHDSPLRFG